MTSEPLLREFAIHLSETVDQSCQIETVQDPIRCTRSCQYLSTSVDVDIFLIIEHVLGGKIM